MVTYSLSSIGCCNHSIFERFLNSTVLANGNDNQSFAGSIGNFNTVTVDQFGGNANDSEVNQLGDNNIADIDQEGNANISDLEAQTGDDNTYTVSQIGNFNESIVNINFIYALNAKSIALLKS